MPTTTITYDEVPYPGFVHPQTHPDRLATVATLFGMDPARPEDCRVLELGCGDGSNLIAMAFALPGGRFVGIDLAAAQIATGQARVESLGLRNLSLRAADLTDLPGDLGEFDYVIAHGLYSWVPAGVRDKALAVCRSHLAPNGVAFVSYSAYPGDHFRQVTREMLRYHAQRFDRPAERVRQGRGLIQFLAEARGGAGAGRQSPAADTYALLLRQERDRLAARQDAALFHDDLSATNDPLYFRDFVAHAGRHGLQYLGEADYGDMRDHRFPPPLRQALAGLSGGDPLALEQYADFVRGRNFRQTLLCRQGVTLGRVPDAQRLRDFYALSSARPVTPAPGAAAPPGVVTFRSADGETVSVSHPLTKAVLLTLGEASPRPLHFGELLPAARARVVWEGGNPAGEDQDAHSLGEILLAAYEAGLIDLRLHCPAIAVLPAERPVASLLARRQAEATAAAPRAAVTNLLGYSVPLDNPLAVHALPLLDGTRDRSALVRDLEPLVRTGRIQPVQDGQPVRDSQRVADLLAQGVEMVLRGFAQAGLLVGMDKERGT